MRSTYKLRVKGSDKDRTLASKMIATQLQGLASLVETLFPDLTAIVYSDGTWSQPDKEHEESESEEVH